MSCCDDKAKPDAQTNGLMGLIAGPRRWWLFGAVGLVAGLTLGWEQLVLFGIAPLLISFLPCLVMCGLGLCMMKCKDKKGGDDTAIGQQSEPAAGKATALQADALAAPEKAGPRV